MVKHLQNSKLPGGCLAKRTGTGTPPEAVVHYSSRVLVRALSFGHSYALRSGIKFHFFYSLLNDDKHGRKKIKEMCLFFLMSVHLADALLLAGSDPPKF